MDLRTLVLNNFWLKALSAVLATAIWFALQNQTDIKFSNPLRPDKEIEIRRDVMVLRRSAEQRPYRVDPAQVTVRLIGDSTIINELSPEDVHVYVNLAALRDPQGALRVEVKVPYPQKVVVQAIAPATVEVRPLSDNP